MTPLPVCGRNRSFESGAYADRSAVRRTSAVSNASGIHNDIIRIISGMSAILSG